MSKNENDPIKLHVAGATVRHNSPFDNLQTLSNSFELSQQFREELVIPFYKDIGRGNQNITDTWVKNILSIKSKINNQIINTLLGDFDWRTRQTGAYFAAIKDYKDYIYEIGNHFLKSELCYAGKTYSLVLASFNTKECVEYLNSYLDYYLSKPELYFDQREAMESIMFLDKINGTQNANRHLNNWINYNSNKNHNDETLSVARIENKINVINYIKEN